VSSPDYAFLFCDNSILVFYYAGPKEALKIDNNNESPYQKRNLPKGVSLWAKK